jgi:putative ATP-dependent endonuclease of OLD family
LRIRTIEIKNFKSLKDVEIKDIGDLTILIGANSSGKSNIMEALALFFNEFDPTQDRQIGAANNYVWFEQNSNESIEFGVTFDLDWDELVAMFPKDQSAIAKEQAELVKLIIFREVLGPASSAKWRTKSVSVNDKFLIRDGERDPESTLSVGEILQAVSSKLKGKFVYIQSARNVKSGFSGLGTRSPMIDSTTIEEVKRVGQNLAQSRQFNEFEELFTRASLNTEDLRVIQNEVTIRETGRSMHFPISVIGGGCQEILGLMHHLLKEEDSIFGIEEPEQHLHPKLARQFFSILKDLSQSRQIFLTTHSTVFVDQTDLKNTFISRIEGDQTKVFRLSHPESLKDILFELGIRPSDIFYSNAVLFVEGPSDRVVYPIWAKKLGIHLDEYAVSVIATYGKSSGKYHLEMWTDATQNVQIPFFMILDKGAEREATKLLKKGSLKPNENLFLLKEGSVEDYYPDEKLLEAIRQEYELTIEDADKEKVLRKPRAKYIEEFLKTKIKDRAKGWQTRIGERAANSMTADEIDEEIKRIIERLRTNLSSLNRGQSKQTSLL